MSLANKYRPKTLEEVVGQDTVKTILSQQIKDNNLKQAYLFTGSAGVGKTSIARIFANEINGGKGSPIEMDMASNNGVDIVREIIDDAQMQSLDSEYKVFLLDEVHQISASGWGAFLKTLEEPPAKAIFIFCTTNPEKIPDTILSRVQKFEFTRISADKIAERLYNILSNEWGQDASYYLKSDGALSYIAKMSDGCMREAISSLEKCLTYSTDITLENVCLALGIANYDTFFTLSEYLSNKDIKGLISLINDLYEGGMDLKLFVKNYFEFILDINTYYVTHTFDYIKIPQLYEDKMRGITSEMSNELLEFLLNMMNDIKYESNSKELIVAEFMVFIRRANDRTV